MVGDLRRQDTTTLPQLVARYLLLPGEGGANAGLTGADNAQRFYDSLPRDWDGQDKARVTSYIGGNVRCLRRYLSL